LNGKMVDRYPRLGQQRSKSRDELATIEFVTIIAGEPFEQSARPFLDPWLVY
jgi:hypothetical protein